VYVGSHFPYSGGTLEYMLARDLETLITDQSPDLINLSAGGYTHGDVPPLSFIEFRQRHPDVTLVTAAGNDSTDRPFWPAAFDWAIAVGALGADLQNLAWFSNHGDWVNVYALGEGVVNAYATGVYTYQEPPKKPAKQVFDGMARWSGTSFAAPLVAGLIVAEMARSQSSAAVAWQAVLGTAANTGGFGPVLLPPP
jgi:subtilisin family serine protease